MSVSLSIMSSSAASTEAVAAAKKAQQEMYSALLAEREVLAHGLETRLTRYKELGQYHVKGIQDRTEFDIVMTSHQVSE